MIRRLAVATVVDRIRFALNGWPLDALDRRYANAINRPEDET